MQLVLYKRKQRHDLIKETMASIRCLMIESALIFTLIDQTDRLIFRILRDCLGNMVKVFRLKQECSLRFHQENLWNLASSSGW